MRSSNGEGENLVGRERERERVLVLLVAEKEGKRITYKRLRLCSL